MDGGAGIVTDNALDYGDALPDGGALIGLDVGTKTIGVATCDAGWRYATAGKTITRGKFYTIANADSLMADLPVGRRVPIENLPPIPLWSRWWLLAGFVACLTAEWILRKRKGML